MRGEVLDVFGHDLAQRAQVMVVGRLEDVVLVGREEEEDLLLPDACDTGIERMFDVVRPPCKASDA